MYNSNIDRLALCANILESSVKAASELGKEPVVNLLKQIITTLSSPEPSPNHSFSLVELVEDKTGIEMNPVLVSLIQKSSLGQVKDAIRIYNSYQTVRNPEGLFYKILTNERNS